MPAKRVPKVHVYDYAGTSFTACKRWVDTVDSCTLQFDRVTCIPCCKAAGIPTPEAYKK